MSGATELLLILLMIPVSALAGIHFIDKLEDVRARRERERADNDSALAFLDQTPDTDGW